MQKYNLKISAKGSRKVGVDFINETKQLAELADCIEIDFNYPHDHSFKKELTFLKKLQKEKNLVYTVHAQYLNGAINDFNKKVREASIKEILKNIDWAKELRANIVVLHPALEPYGLKIQRRQELEIEAYKEIVAYARKKNIKIGLENEAQTCFWFPNRACKFNLLAETVNTVNSENFGFTVDIGHANVTGENYLEALKTLNKKIFHIHSHDNIGSAEMNQAKFNRPDPHLPPGKGAIDWRKVISVLKEINYEGYFELECEVKDMAESINYLKNL